ncbi:UBX domain-containing protein [Musa troglodytarum]|uniref:UBX domain-containing protein n=1 Tax=Musa troglodytarum TaxID=320322 RepID=A0A9E7I4F8_9LILI|nr:UBX domain-containing protein [Musa troglodytarum]
MARFSRDAIDTFMSITGAPEAVALQKLETDDALDNGPLRPSFPLLSATRDVNPFSLLDSKFGLFSSLFDGGGASSFPRHGPRVSHPREVREIPIDFKDDNRGSGPSGVGPRIEEVTGNETAHGHEIHGTVIIDDEDDDDIQPTHGGHGAKSSADTSFGQCAGPSVSPLADMTDYSNEIEEEMIKAAIEASKREAQQHDIHDHPKSPATDDTDLARAVSLSLKTAEQERVLRQQGVYVGENPSFMEVDDAENDAAFNGSQVKSEEENLFVLEESEDTEEQPLVRHRSRHLAPANVESADSGQVSYSASGPPQPIDRHPQHNGHVFENDEWGGISSEEHDEAVMLEAAMFGGIPDGTSYRFGYPPRQMPRPPSPTLTAQRLLREQQDDEYLAALQADREKELKAQQEAQRRLLEEAAAREAALQKQKHEEEENQRKQLEEEELEMKLAAKQSLLPQEPSLDDGNAVTLLVRMPDGSRHGRRFLKSDKLQLLFDYIDVGKVVKPGSYRLVRPYPRRAFTEEESQLSLGELGLTGKQEALFLELI